jgi:hypothetical protein
MVQIKMMIVGGSNVQINALTRAWYSPCTVSFEFLTDERKVTNCMKINYFWESSSCSAVKKILLLLWNPKIDNRVQKSPPLVSIQNRINSLHILTLCFFKIHSLCLDLPFWFSDKSICICHLYHAFYIPTRFILLVSPFIILLWYLGRKLDT